MNAKLHKRYILTVQMHKSAHGAQTFQMPACGLLYFLLLDVRVAPEKYTFDFSLISNHQPAQ